MKIQILGMGCRRCRQLYANVRAALMKVGNVWCVEQIDDILKIMEHAKCCLPALMIDGELISEGTVPEVAEIAEFLQDMRLRV